MKTFRIVPGILAIIPLALLADKLFYHLNDFYDEDSMQTLLFFVVGVPILILNTWAWFDPKIIEFYFLKKDK